VRVVRDHGGNATELHSLCTVEYILGVVCAVCDWNILDCKQLVIRIIELQGYYDFVMDDDDNEMTDAAAAAATGVGDVEAADTTTIHTNAVDTTNKHDTTAQPDSAMDDAEAVGEENETKTKDENAVGEGTVAADPEVDDIEAEVETDKLDIDTAATTHYDWSAHYDDEGRLYYYNSVTEESAWEAPTDEGFHPPPAEPPPVATVPAASADTEPAIRTAEVTEPPDSAAAAAAERAADVEEGTEGTSAAAPAIHTVETPWVAYKDEEGREYYYNLESGETQWDKPEHYKVAPDEDADEDQVAPVNADDTTDSVTKSPVAAALEDETSETNDAADTTTADISGDGEGAVAATTTTAVDTPWVAYKDEEGREYYYNLESGETQWDKPAHYKEAPEEDGEVQMAAATLDNGDGDDNSVTKSPTDTAALKDDDDERSDNVDETVESSSPEPEQPAEEIIDPAMKRLQDAEAELNCPDSVLEPSCMTNVAEVVAANGGNPAKAISALIENYHGQTAVCGLLSRWLVDLHNQTKQGVVPSKDAAKILLSSSADASNADKIREVVQNVINKMAKERFTKEAGDSILDLSKSEAAFLEEMMDSSRWRKLLIDLSASHKDSAVLLYCLRAISKRGHHREIAKRINQSDHFAVFNAMLLSELSVIGSVAVAAGSDLSAATGLEELVQDLTRACSATSYTYLYSVEMLRRLGTMARAEIAVAADSNGGSNDGYEVPDIQERFRRALRKWEALSQILESSMVDPSVSQSVSGSSPLLRKRRLDVALTISELHQRQRRRRRIASNGAYHDGGDFAGHNDILETALLTLLKRHSIGIQLEDAVLDKLLPSGLDMDTKGVGELLIQHPLAVRALIGHLYKPGPTRVTSPSTKNKCSRLVALAMLAAEQSAKEEARARGTKSDYDDNGTNGEETPDELALTRRIVQGSQLCEQVETMISFLVTTDTDTPGQSSTSLGQKLCSLALTCAPVGLGVAIWAREFTHGNEFAASASYPTLSPSILSLVRLVALKHPFARSDALHVALAFLRHSNSDISYQKLSSIKESSIRLLIFLLIKGDVIPVLSSLSIRLQQVGSSELDASLVRYFVGGVLEVVQPPVSPVFVRMFGGLLNVPKVVDAVRSSYFVETNRKRLVALLSAFKCVRLHDGSPLGKEDGSLVSSLLASYQVPLGG
jgi:TH1 protein/WW domain